MRDAQVIPLNAHCQHASRLAYGCMGLGGNWQNTPFDSEHLKHANAVVDTLLDLGITHLDLADIYQFGQAEAVIGAVLSARPELRHKFVIQTKCGIRFSDASGPQRYDFSAQWIEHSVHNSLKRLNLESIDILTLHRPDPLAKWDEVNATLTRLHEQGKFAYLSVSNMHQGHLALLNRTLSFPVIANQIAMSLGQRHWLESHIMTGIADEQAHMTGLVEYCQLHEMQLQAYGSLDQGRFTQREEHQNKTVEQTRQLVHQLAADYACSSEAIALGFLLRHPARIQPIIGTTNIDRIGLCAQATDIELTREHWYQIWTCARGQSLP